MVLLTLITALISGVLGYLVYKLFKEHSVGLITIVIVGFIIPFSFGLSVTFMSVGIILGGLFYVVLVGIKKRGRI